MNALSYAAANAAAVANPLVRTRSRGAGGFGADSGARMELLDILDCGDGRRAYRVKCTYPCKCASVDECLLSVHSPLGARIDAEVVRVSTVLKRGGLAECVFSAKLPSSVECFVVASPQAGTLAVSRREIMRLTRERDLMMVNPGIDALYPEWFERHRAKDAVAGSALCREGDPKFSIVVTLYGTKPEHFREMVSSAQAQTYPLWELVLVNADPENEGLAQEIASLDDQRVKVVALGGNRGISLNAKAGFEASSGDYIAFLDHDDAIEPDTLELYAKAIAENPGAVLVYCDEDSVSEDGTANFDVLLKPDFNVDLELSWNYVLHMLAISRDAYERIDFPEGSIDGYQDYDITLKASELEGPVVHVPRVLYHWRQHSGSKTHKSGDEGVEYRDDSDFAAPGIRALNGRFDRTGVPAKAHAHDVTWLFRVDYARVGCADVSVILAGGDADSTASFVDSLLESDISNVCEILYGAEGRPEEEFNRLAAQATGECLLFVDPRTTRLLTHDAVARMRSILQRLDVGLVSAKAMSVDGFILHAGMCVKDDSSIGYLNQGFADGMGGGYLGCAEDTCDYSAADMLCAMMRRDDFLDAGGFSEDYDSTLASYVDFSFRVRRDGGLVVVNPFAKVEAFADAECVKLGESRIAAGSADGERLWSEWPEGYRRDVLANPNVTLSTGYPRLHIEP